MTANKVSVPDPPPRVYSCFRCGSPTSYFPGRLCQECVKTITAEAGTDAPQA